ncbi:NRDE family protein [Neptuniibacter sp. QD72_48]|uniref:NRDE family protein n=1 Tax=unclassified Neptuniibacter TaxID=2630693 RepID=UPI0039F6F423
MCLITFAYKTHPKYSLILLANRDEFYQRASQAIHFWPDQTQVLAGRDLEQMGTWLGINKAGKFSAVTNFRDGNNMAKSKKSRGELTANFLTGSTDAKSYLAQLEKEKSQYGDFNLLTGDKTGLYYSSNRGGQTQQLQPGVYGMSNALLDTPWPKLTQVKQALVDKIENEMISEQALFEIMLNDQQAADENLPDTGVPFEWEKQLSSSFIRSETYGTRAITLLLQELDGCTTVIEQGYDYNGPLKRSEYQLTLPALG